MIIIIHWRIIILEPERVQDIYIYVTKNEGDIENNGVEIFDQ